MEYITKNSGENIVHNGGAKREDKRGKPRFSLIPIPELTRLADAYTRGAEIYGDYNWANGDLAYAEKAKDSALRHMFQYLNGDTDEDHASAVCWNLFTIEALKRINQEKLGKENAKIVEELKTFLER